MPTQHTILYNWKIGGEAGYGIMNTGGPIFAKTFMRAGFFVFIYSEYPSLIRGGHNTMQVAVSQHEVGAAYRELDQLVALNAHTIILHQDEVKKGGIVVYDTSNIKFQNPNAKCQILNNERTPPSTGTYTVNVAKAKTKLRKDIKFIPIDFTKIAEEVGGDKIMKNVAAVGASLYQFKIQNSKFKIDKSELLKTAKRVLEDVFRKKGSKIVKANQRVLEAGYKSVIGNL